MRRHIFAFLFLMLPLAAQEIPGSYIVELKAAPVRGRTRAMQQAVRRQAETRGRVKGGLEVLANMLFVDTDEAGAAALARHPEVARVYPDFVVKMNLDRAGITSRVPEAWEFLGGRNKAGAGIKIAIIDSGIELGHPGFQDADMAAPEGYPKLSNPDWAKYTSGKVIVARTYDQFLTNLRLTQDERTPRDDFGHGTAVAMAAAGLEVDAPVGHISGIAPKAWIGNYKVFFGAGNSTNSSTIMRAFEDAVLDGMDIINLSSSAARPQAPEFDPFRQVIQNAVDAGLIVIVSAGNDGPVSGGIGTPGTLPSVISIGASRHERFFASSVRIEGVKTLTAIASNLDFKVSRVAGKAKDVATLDNNGFACSALPGGSLDGLIAVIARGNCTFEDKLNNAQAAGAVGAFVYNSETAQLGVMAVGGAKLPASMISNADGLFVRGLLAENPDLNFELRFNSEAIPADPNGIAAFSSRGPITGLGAKPDMVAIGQLVYTATQTINQNSAAIFSSIGYGTINGTSFSAPIVAGAAALLKQARPGLKVEQYQSLLVNGTAPLIENGAPIGVQATGAGKLDIRNSIAGTIALSPRIISWGSQQATFEVGRTVKVTNLGTEADTYSVKFLANRTEATLTAMPDTFSLEPGQSVEVLIGASGAGVPGGEYQGTIIVQGTKSDYAARLPYWLAVPTGNIGAVTFTDPSYTAASGSTITYYVRVVDETGLPFTTETPKVTCTPGQATVISNPAPTVPVGTYDLRIRYTAPVGTTVNCRADAGDKSEALQVTITP